jgi:light-regulated signal transduction histidine kinase (bacteriophytochrome)
LDEESKKQLISIMDSAKRMGNMIDALLQFSRLTRAEFQKTDLDLSQMAQEICVGLKKNEPERCVQTEIQIGLKGFADGRFMQIVLEHLLGNAWKFTSKTPDALVTVGGEIIDGEQIFFVRDNGAGFNMDYIKKLFGPFQRLHREDEFPGEGAGLAIVQRIIQRHGGRIWAKAKPGEGATFYFTLP